MAIFIEGVIASADAGLPFECEKIVSLVDIIGQVKTQPDGPLDVYIQSPGGAIEEGFAIHDYLVSLGRPIRTIALAQCDSIATVVFLAGQTRIARCSLMIHNPWTSIEGDSEAMKASSEGLEACEKRLEKFYSEKLDIDAATISNLMQVETCITPEQALALGFANAQDVPSQSFALITKPNTNKKTKK